METNGADVIAYKDNIKYVIQVKFYNNPVGNKAVQEVVGAIGMYKADKGIVVTNSTFTPSAIELAQANNIELVNGESIEKYKKEILQDVQPIDDEEKYVQKVLDISKGISEDEQLSNDTKMSIEKTFANIGKAFCLEKSQSNKSYNDDDINNFLKMLWEKGEFYDSDGNLLLISDQKDTLEILIRAGIYIMEFFPKVNVILETIVDDNEKMKQIYYEYIDENEDNLFKADRVFALSIMFETDVEEITETINFFYNEKYGISTTDEEDTFDNFDDDNDNLFYE